MRRVLGGVFAATTAVWLLAASAAHASVVGTNLDGALVVAADPGEANEIAIEFTFPPATLVVTDTAGAFTTDPLCAETDRNTISCDASALDAIEVDADDLDDSVSIAPLGRAFFPATLLGGAGDDELSATRWADTIDGAAGDDTLNGGAAGDTLRGQGQDDTLNGGSGNDTMNGGPGVDTLAAAAGADMMNGGFDADSFSGGPDSDTVSYSDRTATVGVFSSIGAFSGNDDDGPFGARDSIAGDVEGLVGGNGNDTIWAQTNDDDLVSGRGGDDELMGIGGPTVFSGGPGTDTATYFNRTNFDVRLSIGDGANDGQSGGGEGDDIQADVENLIGGALDDTLIGDAGPNVLEGMSGADSISGLGGVDTGSYRIRNAGPGMLPVARSAGVTVDIGVGAGNDGSAADDQNAGGSRDTVAGDVEDLIGTPVADTLTGSPADNALEGADGDDTLRGGANEDRLLGGNGDDALIGAAGADVFNGAAGTDEANYASYKPSQPITAILDNAANDGATVDDIDGPGPLTTRDNVLGTVEDVRGGSGNDSLTGNSFANLLTGGPGVDSLFGMGADDTLMANDGVADAVIDCGAGAADRDIVDGLDPPSSGCEL